MIQELGEFIDNVDDVEYAFSKTAWNQCSRIEMRKTEWEAK